MSGKLLVIRMLYWAKGFTEDPKALFRELGVESTDTILEVGCAIGYHTFALAEVASSGKVYALDVWEEGLTHLKGKVMPAHHIGVLHCSGGDVTLPPSSLDKVVCFDTLHEIPDPEGAVEKWTTFLRKGGILLYRDPLIPPERIEPFSKGKLQKKMTVKGIHVFLRQ